MVLDPSPPPLITAEGLGIMLKETYKREKRPIDMKRDAKKRPIDRKRGLHKTPKKWKTKKYKRDL